MVTIDHTCPGEYMMVRNDDKCFGYLGFGAVLLVEFAMKVGH